MQIVGNAVNPVMIAGIRQEWVNTNVHKFPCSHYREIATVDSVVGAGDIGGSV